MSEPSIRQYSLVKELLIGFCLGCANIIPGVSGGTFLLVFKIYERVFAILGRINRANILELVSTAGGVILRPGKQSIRILGDFLVQNDFLFLIKLIIGSVIAIIGLSGLMKYLIVFHFSVTYALFFGLIFVSVIIPFQMLKKKRVGLLFFIAAGMIATVYVTSAVDPYQKAKMKSDLYQKSYSQTNSSQQSSRMAKQEDASENRLFAFSKRYTLNEYFYAGICGAVSISAMVLPGISGSLVLILMGEYFEVVSAISDLKTLSLDSLLFLTCFSVGIILGGLSFARLINMVIKKYYDETMAFLAGLVIGSLYALWPFKQTVLMARRFVKQDGVIQMLENVRVHTNVNIIPEDMHQMAMALIAFICGCVIMSFFIGKENRG